MKGARARRRLKYYDHVSNLTRIEWGEQRVPAGHHIDHIVPRSFGFKHDIPTHLIASRENLQILPANDNIQKGTRITPAALDILRNWNYHDLADAYENR